MKKIVVILNRLHSLFNKISFFFVWFLFVEEYGLACCFGNAGRVRVALQNEDYLLTFMNYVQLLYRSKGNRRLHHYNRGPGYKSHQQSKDMNLSIESSSF